MRKTTGLGKLSKGIVLSATAVMLCAGAVQAAAPEAGMLKVPEEAAVTASEEGTLTKPDHSDSEGEEKLIFIGDSRTVAMRDAVNDNSIWSCKVAMGYDWMSGTGVPQIEDEIDEYTSVIILMGVNDVTNINHYVDYINAKANEWSGLGAKTYFVSVGPVEHDNYTSNPQIESFNSEMEENLVGVSYIDIYSWMTEEGFSTLDGIHYPDSISRDIYEYILDNLEEPRSSIWG